MRKELKWFAEIQERKLKQNDYKHHWSNLSDDQLFHKLMMEMAELFEAISTWDSFEVIDECVDVANFAMMIASNRNNWED